VLPVNATNPKFGFMLTKSVERKSSRPIALKKGNVNSTLSGGDSTASGLGMKSR
jgi:hypothetical protein